MLDIYEPSFTRKLESTKLRDLHITYLLHGADTGEERAETIIHELAQSSTITCQVEDLDEACCQVHELDQKINLYESSDLQHLVDSMDGLIGVDLTSLDHRVWAPVVRALVQTRADFVAVYAEPDDYRRSEELPGSIYDLSTSRGIEPLPGFARLRQWRESEGCFAPLLGFEGARLAHIFDQEEVEVPTTWPVIGSPGFRIEYPTYTYLANRDTLSLDRMDQRVEYARASCPFEAYRALERVHTRTDRSYLRVAPIGTKPHALGSILYALMHEPSVEVIYDHPVRSKGRTHGSRGVYVYEVSAFLETIRD